MSYGLFGSMPWVGKLIDDQSLCGRIGPLPLVINVRCAQFVNSLIFCGLDRKLWQDRYGPQDAR